MDKPFSDSLEKELKSTMGVGLAQVDELKPMILTLTMSLAYLMKNNSDRLRLYKGVPLDIYFVNEAKIQKKDINPFETVEEQMNMLFNKTSIDDQATQLKIFTRNKEQAVQMGYELMVSWFNKDLKKMYPIYENMAQITGNQDYLVKDRNNNWMKTLPGLLAKVSQFIAVGALHLAGPDGLIEQLEHLGYTVTPIKEFL